MNALPNNVMDPQPKFVLHGGYFTCNMCREAPNTEPIQWCDHIKDAIHANKDATLIHPGLTINVPIMPEAPIWAEVHVDSETLPGGVARMEMYYKPDFGNLKKIDLGYWNPGEGLWVMRTVIVDYIRSKLVFGEEVTTVSPILTPCPSTTTHNLAARKWMASANEDITKKWRCLWNIVMEGACTYCVQLGSDPTNSGLNDPLNTTPWKS
jgi:hypothetical protein